MYLDPIARPHVCDVVEIGRSTDHLAASVRVPEKQNLFKWSSNLAPCGQNWQKHKVFDKTFMFKTVFVCLCLLKNLRCVSVNVSVTTIVELCDGVLAD